MVSSYLTSPRNASYDSRNLFNGTLMLRSGYLDQPYCDVMPNGRWICTITASASAEGGKGEHVAALWSDDSGESWSRPVTIEPLPLGLLLPNAYSMTLVAPGVGVGGVTLCQMEMPAAAALTERPHRLRLQLGSSRRQQAH